MKIKKLLTDYPFVRDIFESYNLEIDNHQGMDLEEYLNTLSSEFWEENAITKEDLLNMVSGLLENVAQLEDDEKLFQLETLTIIGGYDKSGNKENIEITVKKGEIISVVGPTGSGKSQLLSDIEWMANADTNTKRVILVNGEKVPREIRYSTDKKLVAQLSQNMNFVVDLTVGEFLRLHAESRLVKDVEGKVEKIIEQANLLAGEKFDLNSPVTALSGGQSRALMIADVAILSKSPIVLIDEIENAGIDRKKALDLLIGNDKIVIMATHDPILALMADKRLIIKNGAISEVLETSEEEKRFLEHLFNLDKYLMSLREKIRYGKRIGGRELEAKAEVKLGNFKIEKRK